jgi:hypothetical protein
MGKKQTLKVKKFSDMDDWSATENEATKGKPKVSAASLDLNTTFGKKFSDIFRKYGLGIESVGIGSWIKNHGVLLDDEKDKVEYRVQLGRYLSNEDLIDQFDTDNPEEFIKNNKSNKSLCKEFMSMYDSVKTGKVVEIDKFSNLQFSVFLDKRVSDINSEIGHIAIWQAAALYLGIIKASEMTDVLAGRMEYYDALTGNDPLPLKKFLKQHNCKISLENLEDATTWAYRVYKDSKFFGELREWNKSSSLMTELLELVIPSMQFKRPY